MNVLSSLLKTFFRRLPDSLITSERYKEFILTNRLSDPKDRLIALKRLIGNLPDYNFETLKYLAIHLRKVAEHGDVNKVIFIYIQSPLRMKLNQIAESTS